MQITCSVPKSEEIQVATTKGLNGGENSRKWQQFDIKVDTRLDGDVVHYRH